MPATCSACGRAAATQTTVAWAPEPVCRETLAVGHFRGRCKRVIAVPLRHRGKVLGVYNLFMGSEAPLPDEVTLLFDSISEHLGMALENARLARENIRATIVNERQMLANEVHDSLAQTLAYMKMRLALLEEAIRSGERPVAEKYLGDVDQAMDLAYGRLPRPPHALPRPHGPARPGASAPRPRGRLRGARRPGGHLREPRARATMPATTAARLGRTLND